MSKCIKCGMCCIAYELVLLTSKEFASDVYEANKIKDILNVTKAKSVYFKEWGAALDVCIYFNENTRKCTIYDHRPKVCRDYFCDGNFKYIYARIMSRIADV